MVKMTTCRFGFFQKHATKIVIAGDVLPDFSPLPQLLNTSRCNSLSKVTYIYYLKSKLLIKHFIYQLKKGYGKHILKHHHLSEELSTL